MRLSSALPSATTLVTNNAVDFRRLYRHLPRHAGLLILIPNLTPKLQQELFRSALEDLGADEWINSVVRSIERETRSQSPSTRCRGAEGLANRHTP
jgi:hypothetical protein